MSDLRTATEPAAMSVGDAGLYLSVSADTVRRLVRAGTIPHARIGNSIRVRRKDLDAYLDEQTTTQWKPVDGRGNRKAESDG
jgi:excisionase family DNA binding protein